MQNIMLGSVGRRTEKSLHSVRNSCKLSPLHVFTMIKCVDKSAHIKVLKDALRRHVIQLS